MPTTIVSDNEGLVLTLDRVKQHIRVDCSFQGDNALILAYMRAAQDYYERTRHRVLMQRTYDETFDYFPGAIGGGLSANFGARGKLTLSKSPLVSVTSVTYYDDAGTSQTWDAANYNVFNNYAQGFIEPTPDSYYPSTQLGRSQAVTVRYIAGYSQVPATIQQAMLLHIGHLYENREPSVVGASISEFNNLSYKALADIDGLIRL
jgi:uncharacterized phiE125 gp8 family phage protein